MTPCHQVCSRPPTHIVSTMLFTLVATGGGTPLAAHAPFAGQLDSLVVAALPLVSAAASSSEIRGRRVTRVRFRALVLHTLITDAPRSEAEAQQGAPSVPASPDGRGRTSLDTATPPPHFRGLSPRSGGGSPVSPVLRASESHRASLAGRPAPARLVVILVAAASFVRERKMERVDKKDLFARHASPDRYSGRSRSGLTRCCCLFFGCWWV